MLVPRLLTPFLAHAIFSPRVAQSGDWIFFTAINSESKKFGHIVSVSNGDESVPESHAALKLVDKPLMIGVHVDYVVPFH